MIFHVVSVSKTGISVYTFKISDLYMYSVGWAEQHSVGFLGCT